MLATELAFIAQIRANVNTKMETEKFLMELTRPFF